MNAGPSIRVSFFNPFTTRTVGFLVSLLADLLPKVSFLKVIDWEWLWEVKIYALLVRYIGKSNLYFLYFYITLLTSPYFCYWEIWGTGTKINSSCSSVLNWPLFLKFNVSFIKPSLSYILFYFVLQNSRQNQGGTFAFPFVSICGSHGPWIGFFGH